jgi:hypothetical protein
MGFNNVETESNIEKRLSSQPLGENVGELRSSWVLRRSVREGRTDLEENVMVVSDLM